MNGARLGRALQQRFTDPHRLLHARGESAFGLGIPNHLRISKTCNVSEFKRDQVDHSLPRAPLCQSMLPGAAQPNMRWGASWDGKRGTG